MEPGERVRLVQALTAHQALIKGYAYAVVRDFHLAEDVYQDVAVVLAEKWDTVPPGPEIVPWLRETTRRKALEALRKKGRAAPLLSDEVLARVGEAFEPDPDCVGKLAPAARRVVEARWGEGADCEAIARRLGRSVQGVYALLKRARLALADCVDRRLAQAPGGGP
jgi:RNA polymerase sigma-70 factor (ECF subfamily)